MRYKKDLVVKLNNIENTKFANYQEGENYVTVDCDCKSYLYEKLGNSIHIGSRKQIDSLINKIGLIKYQPIFETKTAENKISGKITAMVFGVTESCNLACKYCIFSNAYPKSRLPSPKILTWETAKKAIDYFKKRAITGGLLSFYGGEPTLNWELITKTIKYVKKVRPDIQFMLVSNGLRLKELAEEIIDLNLNLTISLDGPKEIHDRYRKTINGSPTFETIWEGIEKIRTLNPDFARTHLSTNATCWDVEDFPKIVDFNISQNGKFRNQYVNFVEQQGLNLKIKRKHGSKYDTTKDYLRYGKMYIKDIANGKNPPVVLQKMFDKGMQNIFRLTDKKMPSKIPLLGACTPGERSLFCDTQGKYFICDKFALDKNSGDINTPIKKQEKIRWIRDLAKIRNEVCKNCWLSRLCGVCQATAKNIDNKMSTSGLLFKCSGSKYSSLINLVLFADLIKLDKNENYYSYFQRNIDDLSEN